MNTTTTKQTGELAGSQPQPDSLIKCRERGKYREEPVYATILGRTSRYMRRVPIEQPASLPATPASVP